MEDPKEIQALLESFRKQYDEVYLTQIGDEDYVWRALGREEYQAIVARAKSEDEAFEMICNTAVLWPKVDFGGFNIKAYIPTQLAPQIVDESGFGDGRRDLVLLEHFRDEMKSFDKQAEVIVNTAFPNISFEDMANWTKEKLMKHVAKAEWQMTVLRKIPLQLTATGVAEDGEAEEQEPFDYMEVANELRKQGHDPMFVMRALYQKEKPSYVERPLVGGTQQTDTMIAGREAWKGEGTGYGRYDIIREQVQKISRR